MIHLLEPQKQPLSSSHDNLLLIDSGQCVQRRPSYSGGSSKEVPDFGLNLERGHLGLSFKTLLMGGGMDNSVKSLDLARAMSRLEQTK